MSNNLIFKINMASKAKSNTHPSSPVKKDDDENISTNALEKTFITEITDTFHVGITNSNGETFQLFTDSNKYWERALGKPVSCGHILKGNIIDSIEKDPEGTHQIIGFRRMPYKQFKSLWEKYKLGTKPPEFIIAINLQTHETELYIGSKNNSAKHLDLNERYNILAYKQYFLKSMVDRAIDEEDFMNNHREMGKYLVKNIIKKRRDNSRIMTALVEVKRPPRFNPSSLKKGDLITLSPHYDSQAMGLQTHIGKILFLQLRRFIFIGNSLQHLEIWIKPEKKELTLLNHKRYSHYVVEYKDDTDEHPTKCAVWRGDLFYRDHHLGQTIMSYVYNTFVISHTGSVKIHDDGHYKILNQLPWGVIVLDRLQDKQFAMLNLDTKWENALLGKNFDADSYPVFITDKVHITSDGLNNPHAVTYVGQGPKTKPNIKGKDKGTPTHRYTIVDSPKYGTIALHLTDDNSALESNILGISKTFFVGELFNQIVTDTYIPPN